MLRHASGKLRMDSCIQICEYMNVISPHPLESSMTTNVGTIDRALRIIVGLALLAFAAFSGSSYWWAGLIGIVPILTAAMGFCPAYTLLGMSTCPLASRK